MSFKSYAVTETADGAWQLHDPKPLIFSGRHGIIARYLFTKKDPPETVRLTPVDIHQLAAITTEQHRIIAFEQAEDSELEILQLESISGTTGLKTEMLFSFRPLSLVGVHGAVPTVRLPTSARTYTEELVLDGGTSSPNGSWRWRKQHLALGGVVCGSAPTPAR